MVFVNRIMERVKTEIISQLKALENNSLFNNKLQKEENTQQQQKSLESARNLREEGNRIYATCRSLTDLHNVYKFYAQSIAHAPAESQEMAFAYSNLSVVLLRLEKHVECLQAIDCCLNSGYPEKSKFKIYLRKIECLKIVGEALKAKDAYDETLAWIEQNQTDAEQKTEMKKKLVDCYRKNVKVKKPFSEKEYREVWKDFSIKKYSDEIPEASDAICLKYSEDQGRHYVATRDIRPGEMIMKTRLYLIVCSKKSRYNYCWECGKFNPNCIPCDVCNNVIFCSFQCKKDAWKNYHRQECGVLHHLFDTDAIIDAECEEIEFLITLLVSAFQVLFRAINEYGSLKNLRKVLDNLDKGSKDPRTNGFSDGKLLDDKYIGFYSLTCFDDVPFEENYGISEVVYKLATLTTLFGEKVKPSDISRLTGNEDMVFAACLIVKHMQIMELNCIRARGSDAFHHTVLKLSILISLFNHSCLNNVRCSGETVLAVLPIKKGDQVSWNYFEHLDKSEALKHSQDKYHFICNCEACSNNWPENYVSLETQQPEKWEAIKREIFSVIPQGFDIESALDPDTLLNALKNRTFRINVLKFYSESINKFMAYKTLPCTELTEIQKLMDLLNNYLMNYNYDEYRQCE